MDRSVMAVSVKYRYSPLMGELPHNHREMFQSLVLSYLIRNSSQQLVFCMGYFWLLKQLRDYLSGANSCSVTVMLK